MQRPGFIFQNTYQQLPEVLFEKSSAKPFASAKPLILNRDLAKDLHIDPDWLESEKAIQILSGGSVAEGSIPIAQAYAGHQFGHFTVLGDGRALLLGEHQVNDRLMDIQLKGSGPTKFSRRGDGLATLAAMLKEYIFGEALHALNIPTTRSLGIMLTGELVRREGFQPGAVLTRVAASHIRVGTFEFARLESDETLKNLADYTIARHDPDLIGSDDCYLRFLERVIDRQASLVAKWMSVGFIHGVMNTDNVTISGQTIDFGPCAFMDHYDSEAVFSSIDLHGRYAYTNQPKIMHWNLCRLAEALIPLIDIRDENLAIEKAQAIINTFSERYEHYWQEALCKKLGFPKPSSEAVKLIQELLLQMDQHGADFTHTFNQLSRGNLPLPILDSWQQAWYKELLDQQIDLPKAYALMRQVNPVVIPRHHIIDKIMRDTESSLSNSELVELIEILRNPYSDQYLEHPLANPKPKDTPPTVTYCGT